MVSPARRRAAVAHLVKRFKVSQRRACRVVGQHRYRPLPTDYEQQLLAAMRKLADRHPRFGYRRDADPGGSLTVPLGDGLRGWSL